ncbi:hypothetical protein ACLOJK_011819 [Asimina triloba]
MQLVTGSLENLLKCVDQVEGDRIKEAMLRTDLPFYMVPLKANDLVFQKPEDNGEKFLSLLRAIGAYAEGFSAEPILRRALYLWNKLKA